MDIHHNAAMVTPDGKPLAVLGALRGFNVKQTTGADLFENVVQSGSSKHFLYGGKPGVAQKLVDAMSKKYPNAEFVGSITPPFRKLTTQEKIDYQSKIINSKADVVWVGLSTPKQENWMYENYQALPCTLIGVGAAFDFHTGEVKRAPKFLTNMMLEWVYRVACEPRRLGRRYFKVVPQFLLFLGLDWIRGTSSR